MPEIAFTRGILTADFFTHSYRISGRVGIGASGIYGILGDSTTAYMELEDAYVSRINDPAKIVAHYALSALRKDRISFIVLNRREEGVSVVRAPTRYTQTKTYPVFATVPFFEIRGKIDVLGKLDTLTNVLVQGMGRFFPIFEATASASLFPDVGFSGEAIVVNKDSVEIFCATGAAGDTIT
jgi:hypothetical protein